MSFVEQSPSTLMALKLASTAGRSSASISSAFSG